MQHRLVLGAILGIPIELHLSWVPVFGFVTWTLATRFFPNVYAGQPRLSYWLVGIIASLLLFGSLLAHELGHAIVARRRGLPVIRISLFILGGMVEVDIDRGSAKDELLMALAGPGASLLLGVLFAAIWLGGDRLALLLHSQLALGLGAIAAYLACCNLLMAAFNLLPAFPLDGGRVLRAALWIWSGSRDGATRWACWLGLLGGVAGVVTGVLALRGGDPITGAWLALVGVFVFFCARAGLPEPEPVPSG